MTSMEQSIFFMVQESELEIDELAAIQYAEQADEGYHQGKANMQQPCFGLSVEGDWKMTFLSDAV